MNPEAIIVFVALIAINALFSKSKAQKQQQRRNQQSQKKQRPTQQGPDQQRSAQQRSTKDSEESRGYGLNQRHEASSEDRKTVRPQRQRPRSLLEEVLQQYNITEDQETPKPKNIPSEEIQENAIETGNEEDHYTDYSNRNLPKKSRKKKELKGYTKRRKNGVEAGESIEDVIGKSSVEKSEIGTEGFDKLLKFDQRSLVQGIVMAEILDKPKATRKKRAI